MRWEPDLTLTEQENPDSFIRNVIETKSFAGLRRGAHLVDIAETLGPPKYWYISGGYSPERCTEMIFGYGHIEVYCKPINGVITVFFAKLRAYRRLVQIGPKFAVRLPPAKKQTRPYIENLLRDIGITPEEYDVPGLSMGDDDAKLLLVEDSVGFVFFDTKLYQIWLTSNSEKE